ncbi:MAG TPA: hypothetical protein VGG34_07210 [Opitutaceae bacterium]|jgi:tetratricopeptide (TPR) repeat protein
MQFRPALLTAFIAAALAGALRADTPAQAESLPERQLKEIVDHQKALFSDASSQGSAFDQAGFTTQVEQLTREYESLLKDSPDFAAGYASYGYMLRKVGLRKQSLAILMKANALDPTIPLVKNEIGNFLAEDGKTMEALGYFLSAVNLEPDEPLYHYELGRLLFEGRDDLLRSGEWSRVALDHAMTEAFRKAAELAPDRIEFTYRYAESFADVQNPDWPGALRAWQNLEARAQSDVERGVMRLQEANVLVNMGKPDAARKVLDSIKNPDFDAQKKKLADRMAADAAKPS